MGFSILRFWVFLRSVFGFCAKRLRFFGLGVHCGLRIFRFSASIFGFRRSYLRFFGFVMRCGFWVFLFCPISGFRFCPNFYAVLRFWVNFSVLHFLLNIPQCPPPLGACNRSTAIYLEINLIEEFKIHAKIEKEMITLTFIRRNTKLV